MKRWVVLAAVGCSAGKFKEVAYEDGLVPGAGALTFAKGPEGRVHAEFSEDGKTWTPSASVSGESGRVPIVGMPIGATLTFRLVEDGPKGAVSAEVEGKVQSAPVGTPSMQLVTWEPDKSCLDGGYTLFSYLGDTSGVGIVGRDGRYVWTYANDLPGTLIARPRPGRDGKSILWNVAHDERIDDLAAIVQLSMDGETRVETRTLNGHHDFVELPDGRLGWLGYEFREMVVPEMSPDPISVAADVIYEDDPGVTSTETAQEIFNVFDQYPGGVFYHDDMDGQFLPEHAEFSHGNGLSYRADEDAYHPMFRWLDTFAKVDRQTGELVWRFGGAGNDFAGDEDELFVHGHHSDHWDDQLLVFDNHDQKPPVPSRLARYTLDESTMTFERTFFLELDQFDNLLGDLRRMPVEGCDNYLVALSKQGRILELTPDGEIVWEVQSAGLRVVTRVHFLPTLYDFGKYAYWEQD